MTNVAPGVFELRLRDAEGIYRVFYYLKIKDKILIFHAFAKKTRATPKQQIETGKTRLKKLLQEEQDENNSKIWST